MSMTDPKYPDGAPEWYKPYMICEFSDDGENWTGKSSALYAPVAINADALPWLHLGVGCLWYKHARPVKPWTPKVGEEVIAWDEVSPLVVVGKCEDFNDYERTKIGMGGYYDHSARLHNEDGSCIDVSGGIEEIKTRTPWV